MTSQRVRLPFLISRDRKRKIEETPDAQDFLLAARAGPGSLLPLSQPQIRPHAMSIAYNCLSVPKLYPLSRRSDESEHDRRMIAIGLLFFLSFPKIRPGLGFEWRDRIVI